MTELLSMSAQGAVLILAVAALRALFGRRVPPTLLYALWLLPAARLLIPGSVASAFSLANLVPAEAGRRVEAALHTVTAAAAPAGGAAASVSPAVSTPAEVAAPLDLGQFLLLLWLAGAAAVVLLALWHNLAFARRVKQGAVPVEVPCPLPVYLSGGLTSPCLCGLFRPAVYLCDGALTSQAGLDMALAHELVHWRAGDRFWALLRLACCAVHWFNPLVWLGARLSVQDCERACDHRVLRGAGQAEREAYGLLLLSYLNRPAPGHSLLLTSSPMASPLRALRGRIALIGQRPRYKRAAAILLALCAAAACLAACTGAEEEAAPPSGREGAVDPAGMVETTGGPGVTGRTFLNCLDTEAFVEVAPEDFQLEESQSAYLFLRQGDPEGDGWSLTLHGGVTHIPLEDFDLVAGDPADFAQVIMNGAESWYALGEDAARLLGAMSQLSSGSTFRSALPEGGEMALVCSGPAMGHESHWLFRSDNGADYTPVQSDLDRQYARVAEGMCFVSDQVGFISFRWEQINGYRAPNLYRTADGGATWQRAELPMGDITTDNGYSGMHITAMEFSDARTGAVTVEFYAGGTEEALSCSFSTADGGLTWTALGSRPAQAP